MNKCKISNIMPRQKLYGTFDTSNLLLDIIFNKIKKTKKQSLIKDRLNKEYLCNHSAILNHERIGLYLIIKYLVQKNPFKKEIIMSPFTIWDIVNMVILAGGKPVFIDIKSSDLTISNQSIRENFNDRTLAVIYTHYQILSDDLLSIKEYVREKQSYLIEDCAIFNGSNYLIENKIEKNEFRLLSFGRSKIVSSISGGAILFNNDEFNILLKKNLYNFRSPSILWTLKYSLKKLKLNLLSNDIFFRYFMFWIIKYLHMYFFKTFSKLSDNDPNPVLYKTLPKDYECNISDYQINNIIGQLNNNIIMERNIRIRNAKYYYEKLKNIKQIKLLNPSFSEQDVHINFPLFCDKRDKLYKYLISNNYDCSTYFYKNCNSLKIFEKYKKHLPNVKRLEENILILPTYPSYPKKNILNICELIEKFYK